MCESAHRQNKLGEIAERGPQLTDNGYAPIAEDVFMADSNEWVFSILLRLIHVETDRVEISCVQATYLKVSRWSQKLR